MKKNTKKYYQRIKWQVKVFNLNFQHKFCLQQAGNWKKLLVDSWKRNYSESRKISKMLMALHRSMQIDFEWINLHGESNCSYAEQLGGNILALPTKYESWLGRQNNKDNSSHQVVNKKSFLSKLSLTIHSDMISAPTCRTIEQNCAAIGTSSKMTK